MFLIEDKLSNTKINLDLICAVRKDPENSAHLIVEFDPTINKFWYNHLVEELQSQMNWTINPVGTYRIYDFSMDKYKNALTFGYQWFDQNVEKI